LADQVDAGELPEPDYIYVACGTLGTAAGLVLGLKAAGLRSRVVAVKVVTGTFVSPSEMTRLIERTNHLLHSSDAGFPELLFSAADFDFRDEWCGKQYALFTREGMEAVRLIEESEGIQLDGTYTGKTLAALVDDARRGKLRDKSVLFWNTLNSRDFSDSILNADYRNLPRCFHRYFEEPPQPLDRD
jgi:1-aminocyclopropane-1-carboxylate deaminase/D-cysteine desulfhydrase-like pyridoxal-dependent ACC family enzyme